MAILLSCNLKVTTVDAAKPEVGAIKPDAGARRSAAERQTASEPNKWEASRHLGRLRRLPRGKLAARLDQCFHTMKYIKFSSEGFQKLYS